MSPKYNFGVNSFLNKLNPKELRPIGSVYVSFYFFFFTNNVREFLYSYLTSSDRGAVLSAALIIMQQMSALPWSFLRSFGGCWCVRVAFQKYIGVFCLFFCKIFAE